MLKLAKGCTYVMKFNPSVIPPRCLEYFLEGCREAKINVMPLATFDLDAVRFTEDEQELKHQSITLKPHVVADATRGMTRGE